MERFAHRYEISKIKLRNIRGFRELDLDLRGLAGRPRSRTLIIGKNGTSKSTLLRAISIGLTDRTDGSRLLSEPIGGFLRANSEEGALRIWLDGFDDAWPESDTQKNLHRAGEKESIGAYSDLDHQPFVCGYGAGRYGPGPYSETSQNYRISDAVLTLFRYYQALSFPELTLRRLKSAFSPEVYERSLQSMQRAVGLSEQDKIEVIPAGGVTVSGPTIGGSVPLEGWADGYRLTFNWILDLYSRALQAGSVDKEGNIEGILLIDEIEQHLHPSMQAEILPRLSELLPKMQIFATTHSPLVALDAKPEELVVLRREGDQVVAQQSIPDFSGYSAEDMLADPRLFDSPVYGEETREKLSEYNELVSIPQAKRSREQVSRLRSLANEVSALGKPEDRETESTRILKQLIAKHGL